MFTRGACRLRLVGLFSLVSVLLLLTRCASQQQESGSQQEPADALDEVIEQYDLALGEFVKGNPEPVKQMFSHQEDVTLANPLGPPARGWEQVAQTIERASSNFSDGEFEGFEIVSKYATPELAYVHGIERTKGKVSGREDMTPIALRVTMIFRPEDGTWKVVHRHADPITTDQSIESVLQE